jgi:glc operon protein GlcG
MQERAQYMEISLEKIQSLVSKAVEYASSEFKRPVCVAVCDNHGLLLAFMRMPGVTLRSVPIAQRKAYTAAFMVMDTVDFAERLKRENVPAGFFCNDQLTGLPGGVVLKDSAGVVVGAAGVSGLTPAEDQSIASMMAAYSQRNI